MFACMGYVNRDIWISNSSRRDWAPETSETESRAGDYGCPFSTNDLKRQRYYDIYWGPSVLEFIDRYWFHLATRPGRWTCESTELLDIWVFVSVWNHS